MKLKFALVSLALAFAALPVLCHAEVGALAVAEETWAAMLKGNAKYAAGTAVHPRQGVEKRHHLNRGQKPAAVVLTCADSRVAPELIFDQGLGDLYVVRVSGNVAEPATVASVEYAVEHFEVPLIVVMGHEGCDTVKDAVRAWITEYDKTAPKDEAPPEISENVNALFKYIFPAIEVAHTKSGDLMVNSVETNVTTTVWQLTMKDKYLSAKRLENKLIIKGVVYNMFKGTIKELDTKHDQNSPEKEPSWDDESGK